MSYRPTLTHPESLYINLNVRVCSLVPRLEGVMLSVSLDSVGVLVILKFIPEEMQFTSLTDFSREMFASTSTCLQVASRPAPYDLASYPGRPGHEATCH